MNRSWSLVFTLVAPALAAACSSDSSTSGGSGGDAAADGSGHEGGSSGGSSHSDASASGSSDASGSTGSGRGDATADAANADAADAGNLAADAADGASADASGDASKEGGVSANFSFFVTSKGGSDGGDLGGLTGADQRCQAAAAAVGAGSKTWHAYLSVSAGADGGGQVNARDRIGTGPWYNVKGVLIAANLAALHEEGDAGMNGITAATGLDENGNVIPGGDADAGVAPQHDILTGSTPEGRAYPPVPDYTCAAWTSSQAGPPITMNIPPDASLDAADAAGGAASDATVAAGDAATDAALADGGTDASTASGPVARVGHVNRVGSSVCPFCAADASVAPTSWNSAHPTPGCSQNDLVSVGGIGRLYCFAIH